MPARPTSHRPASRSPARGAPPTAARPTHSPVLGVGTLDVLTLLQVGLQVHLEEGWAAGVVGASHRPVVAAALVVPAGAGYGGGVEGVDAQWPMLCAPGWEGRGPRGSLTCEH